MKNSYSIFRQLILNVIIPVVIAILILGIINYVQTKDILVESNHAKNEIITDEIMHILSFQDYALELVEENMFVIMKKYSDSIVNDYFPVTDNIESADFYALRDELGMDSTLQDIYIINSDGIVVNTTFKKDLGLNLFNFGEIHKNYLLNILKSGEFVNERISFESSTKKLKKYTYHPTKDGKYIVELGFYSSKATEIVELSKQNLNEIETKYDYIVSVDMFVSEDNPISFNKNSTLDEEGKSLLTEAFKSKSDVVVESNDGNLQSDYIYVERKGSDLYKGSVIRIISDKSKNIELLKKELLSLLGIFAITIISVVFLIYKKTKVITFPIKKLVENVTRISEGNLNERAEVQGSNEIANLSMKFNLMVERLEESYNDLEQKVIDRTAEIQHQKVEIEEQNKHIMDSIYYAKRIQTAILPADAYVKTMLPNAFLLYKPKDIVSGDFYWLNTVNNDVLIAAVDCTGHGVPGAFMSIIGHNQLNHALNVEKATKPSEILDQLNVGVTNSLNQKQAHSGVKDGMDIALCNFNFAENKVQFAGAFNPMYIITNNPDTIEKFKDFESKEFQHNDYYLFEIKGDKQPIGSFVGENVKPFVNNEFQLNKGDTVYIFSDGYADQFGGPRGKKFRYKNFKEMLLEFQDKSMAEQNIILDETIENWRGDLEQIDDVLVIGIRL